MRRLIFAFCALILSTLTFAQESVRVNCPDIVAVGEQFNVTVTVSGSQEPSKPEWNPGSDFKIVWGPQRVGKSTSISIINGKKTSSVTYTYTYILMSQKEGTYQIPPLSVQIGDQTVYSNSVTVKVALDPSASAGTSSSSSAQSSQGATEKGGNGEAFLRFVISKSKVVVGEPITATLKLFTRADVIGFEDAKLPTFNGFWSQETYAPKNIDFKRETIGNKMYLSAVLREYTLIPQQTGDIVIDPAEITCVLRVANESSSLGSVFDSFFEDPFTEVRKKAVSAGYTVKVSPLPQGAPASFAGGVGDFAISASLAADTLDMHQASSLKIVVSGKGNVSLLEAPKVSLPSDFEVYDVKSTDNTDASKLTGSKTFEYPFIPRSYGDFTIAPIEYSYYDYQKGRYVTQTTPPLHLYVRKKEGASSGDAGSVSVFASNRKNVKDLGTDIKFVSVKNPVLRQKGHFFAGSGLFFILFTLIVLVAGGLYVAARKNIETRSDVALVKNRAATKMAKKRLSLAGDLLSKNLRSSFYEELHRALLGFASDKMNIDMASLSKENISEHFASAGVPESIVKDYVDLVDSCEYERYSPSEGQDTMDKHYNSAISLISAIDSSMKNSKKKPSSTIAGALLALLLLSPLQAKAANDAEAENLWKAGIEAYQASDWTGALDNWCKIEEKGLESSDLYFNIGNAYYKKDELGFSILYYERALKFDPSFADARHNLLFAQERTQDQIDEIPEFFLKTWIRKASWLFSADAWAVICLVFLAFSAAMVLLFLLGQSTSKRKFSFIAGIVAVSICLLSLSFSLWQKNSRNSEDSAIIVSPFTKVLSSPGNDTSKELFILHEGTKVEITDQVGDWYNVTIADGREGWIKSETIQII